MLRVLRQVLKLAVSVGAGLLVTACGDPDLKTYSVGDWYLEGKVDRVSDRPAYIGHILTRSRQDLAHPLKLQLAELRLTCFDGAPAVYFKFGDKVGTNRYSRLSYRFDQNPGRTAPVQILRDQMSIVMEDQDAVARFVAELRTATTLIVQITSLTNMLSTADFNVAGGHKVADTVYDGCPTLPPEKTASADKR